MSNSINLSNMFASNVNDYSYLFQSNNNSSNNNASSMSSILSDWAGLKNGSYFKLTKAYYSKNSSLPSGLIKSDDSATVKSNNILKNDAEDLKSSISALTDSQSLYTKKIETTDADGNKVQNYDYDKLYKAVKGFVDDYNTVLDRGSESNDVTVLRNTLQMTNMTSVNSNQLDNIGISVGADNKLSIDEKAFKASSMSDIKSMFYGSGSYASSIEGKATNIVYAINKQNNKLNTYTASGTYSSAGSIGNIYDGTY